MTVLATLTCVGGSPALAATTHPYVFSFDGFEVPEGHFAHPEGVAVDKTAHSVYVADAVVGAGEENVVDHFTETGGFLGQITGSEAPGGELGGVRAIAVDNSGTASDGTLYVATGGHIDAFDSSGHFSFAISASSLPGEPFGPEGLAINAQGQIYVSNGETGVIDKFSSAGVFLETIKGPSLVHPRALAIDSAGDIYAITGDRVAEFNPSGEEMREVDSSEPRGVTVDVTTGDVYVTHRTSVAEYSSTGGFLSRFGSGHLSRASGIAIDDETEAIFVSDEEALEILSFGPAAVAPDAETGACESVAQTSVTVNGLVNPASETLPASFQFEYGTTTAYGAVSPVVVQSVGTGLSPTHVTAELTALEPNTLYHYRLLALNANGTTEGEDHTCITVGPPSVGSPDVSTVGSTEVTLDATLDPNGSETRYFFEVGKTAAYELGAVPSSAGVVVGAGRTTEVVEQRLTGLAPATTYHFRAIAVSAQGISLSVDATFTTLPTTSGLPEDRAYEPVSPADKEDGNVYSTGGWFDPGNQALRQPFVTSTNGEKFIYEGDPSSGGNGVSGNEYLATRTPSGWTSTDISPGVRHVDGACSSPKVVNLAPFSAFSSDLSIGVLAAIPTPGLAAETGSPACYASVFVRDNLANSYRSALTASPPNRTAGTFGLGPVSGEQIGSEMYAGASSDFRDIFFMADDALVAPAVDGGIHSNNLYESSATGLRTINVLPDGTGQPDATFGAPPEEQSGESPPDVEHAVSASGNRAFWTAIGQEKLYVSEKGSPTVQVDASQVGEEGGGGKFWTASTDGADVLFSDGAFAGLTSDTIPGSQANLYSFNVNTHTLVDLTGGFEAVGFDGVLGAAEDDSYVYFAANGLLAPGATGEEQHLYVWHAGAIHFIANLSNNDDAFSSAIYTSSLAPVGDWRGTPADRTAEATPDGTHLVFMSVNQLTSQVTAGQPEVYMYDATSGSLTCVSCSTTGSVPSAPSAVFPSQNNGVQPTWITDDGSKVFFDSQEALSPLDRNRAWDVYEYSESQQHLISGGMSSGGSHFDNATPSGTDIFFTTRERLVQQDEDEETDIYDARIGGGFAAPGSSSPCDGDGCRGRQVPPPSLPSAASLQLGGSGNLDSSATILRGLTVGKGPVTETRARKLAAALRACKKKLKAERAKCTKRARSLYGALKAKKSGRRKAKQTKSAIKGGRQ